MVQGLIVRRDSMPGAHAVVYYQQREEKEKTKRKVRNHREPKMYSQVELILK